MYGMLTLKFSARFACLSERNERRQFWCQIQSCSEHSNIDATHMCSSLCGCAQAHQTTRTFVKKKVPRFPCANRRNGKCEIGQRWGYVGSEEDIIASTRCQPREANLICTEVPNPRNLVENLLLWELDQLLLRDDRPSELELPE